MARMTRSHHGSLGSLCDSQDSHGSLTHILVGLLHYSKACGTNSTGARTGLKTATGFSLSRYNCSRHD